MQWTIAGVGNLRYACHTWHAKQFLMTRKAFPSCTKCFLIIQTAVALINATRIIKNSQVVPIEFVHNIRYFLSSKFVGLRKSLENENVEKSAAIFNCWTSWTRSYTCLRKLLFLLSQLLVQHISENKFFLT